MMYKKLNFLNSDQLEEILDRFHKKNILVGKKNYTWLFVVLAVIGTAAAAFAVYKFFFAPVDGCDCCGDYDYDDDDDIDYDDDYEDEEYDEDDLDEDGNED